MRRCWASRAIREEQMKATVIVRFTLVTMAVLN